MSVRPSVREHESKSVKMRISAPARLSATGGRVSGLVFLNEETETMYNAVKTAATVMNDDNRGSLSLSFLNVLGHFHSVP